MKIMTYNILNGAAEHFEVILQTVNDQSPDFLAVNEANGFDKNDNAKLKDFAAKGSFPYFELAKCGDGDDYHVAVFSKFPLFGVEHLQGFARAAIATKIKSDFGEVSIVSTHLTPYTEVERLNECQKIIAYQNGSPNSIVMGDLNSLSKTDNYDETMVFAFNAMQTKKFTAKDRLLFDVTQRLTEAGYADPAVITHQQKLYTAPTTINEFKAHSNMRLDYILLSTDIKERLYSYRVLKNPLTETASDHYPVVVELR